ncbi:hypothetical protein DUZ99_16255 [Xylanibacillus composti]|uniref:Uncharacterized protein n=1 Tax=Xylanibacillus composti TaxID=1572762 RepID=A0A8J4H131_9BACL|nr:hypothetical protein [Xylanibacillus composti]MDT9726535.1 hypothetical protein [Xylanibacillus composti]GIQ68954.1 hypothetical protein XYCOK13_17780 [Xylanibacillus composti]
MTKADRPQSSREELLRAWERNLPSVLNQNDQAKVNLDQGDERALRITIQTAGRTGYNFDFKCTYMDDREVDVQLVDVESEGQSVDERNEQIQELISDYVRHIHECAQMVIPVTHA